MYRCFARARASDRQEGMPCFCKIFVRGRYPCTYIRVLLSFQRPARQQKQDMIHCSAAQAVTFVRFECNYEM